MIFLLSVDTREIATGIVSNYNWYSWQLRIEKFLKFDKKEIWNIPDFWMLSNIILFQLIGGLESYKDLKNIFAGF